MSRPFRFGQAKNTLEKHKERISKLQKAKTFHVKQFSRQQQCIKGCLLYTSDAADEAGMV